MKSKAYILIVVSVLFMMLPSLIKAQEKVKVEVSGFVSTEAIYDSRKVVSAREGDVVLYPTPVVYDANGVDINEKGEFSLFSIHSRLRAKTSGAELWGGKLSSLIEFDFVGNANDKIGLVRLRHAMVKLDFGKTNIIFGQYWNPMFIISCYPEVSSWGSAAPISVLSRSPQIRLSQNITDKFTASLTALSQFDYKSSGPLGASSAYIHQSSLPEIDVHLEYGKADKALIGIVSGTKSIVPRQVNAEGNSVDESIRSYHAAAYFVLKSKLLTFKLQGIYAQNGSDLTLLGGYAVSDINTQTNTYEYTPVNTFSWWTELITNYQKVNFGLFAGMANNLGSSDPVASGGAIYARGTDIDYVARISPRLILGNKDVKVMVELNQLYAGYGTSDSKLKVSDVEQVGNTRLQLHLKYSF